MDVKDAIKNIILKPRSFLFENLGVGQTIFKNTFWLASAEGITRFLKLVLIIYVARILGAGEYGKFAFALSFAGVFAIFSDFGLSTVLVREFAREKEKEKEFSSILSLKTILSLATLLLIYIGSLFITSDFLIRKVIWILGIYVIANSFLSIVYAFFQARQKMEYQAWGKILQAIVVAAGGFFVLFNFPSVQNLSLTYLFASLITLIFALSFFHLKIYKLKLGFNKVIWKDFLSMSWPLALAGVFATIYSQTDSVMMGYWGQITQTGWYNAAYKIVRVVLIPGVLITTGFFPALSVAFKESKEKLQKIWNYFMESMIFLGVPIVVGGIALAPRVIDWVYDPSYSPSIFAFQILIIMAGISFLCYPFSQALVVSNQQKRLFWITFFGAIVNVILNLILIPKYSLYGAAFTTVVTYLLVLFLLFEFTSRITPIKPINLRFLSNFIGSIVSSMPMYFVITQPQIYHLNVILSVLIGAGIYIVCFLLYKKVISKICLLGLEEY